MSRFRASIIHLLISAALAGSVIAVIFWFWYPKPAFEVAGASSIMQLLIGVHLVLGPLLTLIVYKHGKPGLKLDLSIIVLIQMIALVYGAYTLYDERPHYMVFSIDRLEFVAKKRIDESQIQFDELRDKTYGNLTKVFARAPEDPDEFQRFLNSVFAGEPDLESRAEFWEPWEAGAEYIRNKITPLESFETDSSDERAALDKASDKFRSAHSNLGVLPIGGIDADISMLLDIDTLEVLGVLHVNPW